MNRLITLLLASCMVTSAHAGSASSTGAYTYHQHAETDELSRLTVTRTATGQSSSGLFEFGDGGLVPGYFPDSFTLMLDFHVHLAQQSEYSFRWNPQASDWVLYRIARWEEPWREQAPALPHSGSAPQNVNVARIACCTRLADFNTNVATPQKMSAAQQHADILRDVDTIREALKQGASSALFSRQDNVHGPVTFPMLHELEGVLDDSNVRVLNDYAFYLTANGNAGAARVLLEAIHRRYPQRVVATLNLADAYWATGEKAAACPLYQAYVEQMQASGRAAKVPAEASQRAQCPRAVTIQSPVASRVGQYLPLPDGALQASWAGGEALVKDVLGTQGENTRTLVRFNGRAALHYDAVASGHPYEAYFTLGHGHAGVVVDCIYASIRDGMTGALIAKAVCGLDAPLNAGYPDLLSAFEDQWRQQLQPGAFSGFANDPGKPIRVVDAHLGGVDVTRVYASVGELTTQWPETRASAGERSRSLGREPIYIVHERAAPTTAVAVEVASGDESEPFRRMDGDVLSEWLKSTASAGD